MAAIEPDLVHTKNNGQGEYSYILWSGIANGDTGAPIFFRPSNSDRTVQVTGALGGASVTLQGSLNGVDYFNLTDPGGAAVTFTDPGAKFITEVSAFYRVSLVGGSGSNVDVYLVGVGG